MDFIDELKQDLIDYQRAYDIMLFNEVFTKEERQFMWKEILRIKELLEILGETK